jgi:hypothetical protein
MRIPTPSPPFVHPEAIALSDPEKSEALADTLKTQFQSVDELSLPAVIELVDVALRSYFQTPANEPTLTNPNEVHEAIRSFRFDGAPGPNGIRTEPWSILPRQWHLSWSRSSTQFSSPTTLLSCGSTLV